jgi:S-adenosylmethionine:tRNA ribosyltransferase-isomerase
MTRTKLTIDDLELTASYDFELPKELVAQEPLANREDSRLLVASRAAKTLEHAHTRDLFRILEPGDCLVLNDTKVNAAKLVGVRDRTGGRWQGLVMEISDNGFWKLLSKSRGRIERGETITLEDRNGKPRCQLVMLSKLEDRSWIAKPLLGATESTDPAIAGLSDLEVLDALGRVPLPHYIRGGHMVDADVEDYQTIYAKHRGSIAAPTAGFHFTQSLLIKLLDRGVYIASVTLHVGVATFRPISSQRLSEHEMHTEWGRLTDRTAETINNCREAGGRIIAVGTTSARVLETVAQSGTLRPWEGDTNLFIRPGFQFRAIDGLITNFHLPKSTLIVLVRAFGGDELIRHAYQVAIDERYRFFSYGDAMLILP